MMNPNESPIREVVSKSSQIAGHLPAMIVGLVLMVVGLGLGVTIVLLPFGLPLGLVGLVLFLWGLSTQIREGRASEDGPSPGTPS